MKLVLAFILVSLALVKASPEAEAKPYWGPAYGLHPDYFYGPKCDEEQCDACAKDFEEPVNCRKECLACKDCKGDDTDSEYCEYCKNGYFACTRTCFRKQDECIACAPKCNAPKCDEDQCSSCMEEFPAPIFAKSCRFDCAKCIKDPEAEGCDGGVIKCVHECAKRKDTCLYCAPRCKAPKMEEKEE